MAETPGPQARNFQRVGLFYHPESAAAQDLARELERNFARANLDAWTRSAWDDDETLQHVGDRDLLLSIGGDGTVLRVAHLALQDGIPILGINMGKVGFMNELSAQEAREKLPGLLCQKGWLDDRTTLQAQITPSVTEGPEGQRPLGPMFALNDVVVARGRVARVVRIQARIDGDLFTTYKGDGVIVASATGSTSYSMAAGGPILSPLSREFILIPITSHLTISNPLVLPPTTVIELTVSTDHEVIISVDGQIERVLQDGDKVSVTVGPKKSLFLRFQPQGRFYSTVTQRLTRME